jgi:hypothetical protein
MPAALMISHHFSISAFWRVCSASGVLLARIDDLSEIEALPPRVGIGQEATTSRYMGLGI